MAATQGCRHVRAEPCTLYSQSMSGDLRSSLGLTRARQSASSISSSSTRTLTPAAVSPISAMSWGPRSGPRSTRSSRSRCAVPARPRRGRRLRAGPGRGGGHGRRGPCAGARRGGSGGGRHGGQRKWGEARRPHQWDYQQKWVVQHLVLLFPAELAGAATPAGPGSPTLGVVLPQAAGTAGGRHCIGSGGVRGSRSPCLRLVPWRPMPGSVIAWEPIPCGRPPLGDWGRHCSSCAPSEAQQVFFSSTPMWMMYTSWEIDR